MHSYLTQPLPLITGRIQFDLHPIGPLPIITYRTDFATQGLKTPDGDVSINGNDSDRENEDNSSDAEMDDLPLSASHSTHSASMNGDDDCSTTVSDEDDQGNTTQKIAKPIGQAGRPQSGGYTLEREIRSWGAETILKVTTFVRTRENQLLDINQSYRYQKPLEIKKICVEATKHYPIVDKYDNQWPIRDMLKLYLKNSSASYRQAMKSNRKQKGKAQTTKHNKGGKEFIS